MIPYFTRPRHSRLIGSVLAGMAGLALAGCSLAPTYVRPAVIVPSTLGGSAPPASGYPSAAEQDLYSDERAFLAAFAPDRDLVPLVRQALTHNADFRLAALRVEEARAQYRIQHANRLPILGLGVTESRQNFSNGELSARYRQDLRTVTAGVNDYEVDLFGRLKSLSDASRQRFLASRFGQEAARGALIAEVLRTYTLERAANQALIYTKAIEADSDELLRITTRQYEIGLISRDELDHQQARADQAKVATLQAADDQRAAIRALQLLTGYALLPEAGNLDALALPQHPLAALQDLESHRLLERPDIRQAEAELQAANADIGAARAALFPSIRLTTALGTASQSLDGLFESGTRMWSFMPQLTLPIFDFGRNQANLGLAWTRKQAGVVEYERTIQAAFREVADALDAHATLAQAMARQMEQDERTQGRLARLAQRARAQLADHIGLLAERIDAQQSAMARLRAQRDFALNRIALFRAFYGVSLTSSF